MLVALRQHSKTVHQSSVFMLLRNFLFKKLLDLLLSLPRHYISWRSMALTISSTLKLIFSYGKQMTYSTRLHALAFWVIPRLGPSFVRQHCCLALLRGPLRNHFRLHEYIGRPIIVFEREGSLLWDQGSRREGKPAPPLAPGQHHSRPDTLMKK